MQRKDRVLIFLIIFMILGAAMSMQFRSILSANRQKASTVYELEELKTLLAQEKETGQRLRASIDENQKNNDAYVKNLFDNKNEAKSEQERAHLLDVQLKAGLTDVSGPGVAIRLDDAKAKMVENPNLLIIHDTDIVKILNELKKAGAQAISVNDERIIALSEQICAGPTIRINRTRYTAPFTIKAIGDPEVLYDSVLKSDIVALMMNDNIGVAMEKFGDITVPKYSGRLESLITGLEVTENEVK